jgi:UDP-N-acetylmuramyl pentapeptide synthase
VVLGEVGEPVGRRKDVYRRIGERVAQVASGAIFIAEHGRFRDYRAGAGRAGFRPDAVLHAGQRAGAAVEALRDDLGPGDVVLIKGRVSQRLARVALALMGRDVRCELTSCEAEISCDRCPMLERGW